MDNRQFGPAEYKGSAFNIPIDRSKWTRHPVASNLVTRVDRRSGTTALKEVLEVEKLVHQKLVT